MKILKTSILTNEQKLFILELWNKEYPAQLKHESLASLENYFASINGTHHLFLMDASNKPKGWFFQFQRDNEPWFAMILSSSHQGKGMGSLLLKEAKEHTNKLYGWAVDHNEYFKADGSVYPSPLAFYLKNDFQVLPKERLNSDKLSSVKVIWQKD